ncbi:Phosphotransferase [Quillaja saponaria]|uniref:Phosphotransferase n=1 Tax=Quillaja saponaria TaxID=32244 RepID=A0AAD7P7G3_QUISA|nr:Phosphotransferase [Quillaja saponaria]
MRNQVVVASVGTTATVVAIVALVRKWKRKKERQLKQTRNIVPKLARECATLITKLFKVNKKLYHLHSFLIPPSTNSLSHRATMARTLDFYLSEWVLLSSFSFVLQARGFLYILGTPPLD